MGPNDLTDHAIYDMPAMVDFLVLISIFPGLDVKREFKTFEEIVNFRRRFMEDYINAGDKANITLLVHYENKIKQNNLLSIGYFRENIELFFSKQYYLLLNEEIAIEVFMNEVLAVMVELFVDNSFDLFWDNCYFSQIFQYSKHDGHITVLVEKINNDQALLDELFKAIRSGEKFIPNENLIEVVIKILNINILLPWVPDSSNFRLLALDSIFKEAPHPSKLDIVNIEELIECDMHYRDYAQLLFTPQVVILVQKKLDIRLDRLCTEKEAKEVLRAISSRTSRYGNYYKGIQKGETFFEGNFYLDAVKFYFSQKLKKAKTQQQRDLLNEEIEVFYERMPEYKEANFLEKYRPLAEAEILQKKEEAPPPALFQLEINGKTIDFTPESLGEELKVAIEEQGLDFDAIRKRLSRLKIWDDLVLQVIKNLQTCSDNYDNIITLQKDNPKRIQVISQINNKYAKGGDRAIVLSIIDDGHDAPLCAIVFVVEFTNHGNIIEILVRKPEDVIPEAGKKNNVIIAQEITESLEKKQDEISQIPVNIHAFLEENRLSSLEVDLDIEKFQETVAYYIFGLLRRQKTYSNELEKQLVEKFLGLCIDNSRMKEAIVLHLAKLISNDQSKNELEILFGSDRNPQGELYAKPRIVARNILSYLARKENSSAKEYEHAFTDEADVLFNNLGEPDKKTATKEWITSNAVRIHFCYVGERLRIAATWNYHH